MEHEFLQTFFHEAPLNVIGGFVGGGMALCVVDAMGTAQLLKRMFCSLACAVGLTPGCCAVLAYFYPASPKVYVIPLTISSAWGVSGWFVMHWFTNWLVKTKDKTIWEVLSETFRKTSKLRKGR